MFVSLRLILITVGLVVIVGLSWENLCVFAFNLKAADWKEKKTGRKKKRQSGVDGEVKVMWDLKINVFIEVTMVAPPLMYRTHTSGTNRLFWKKTSVYSVKVASLLWPIREGFLDH